MGFNAATRTCDTVADLRTVPGVAGRLSKMSVLGHTLPNKGGGGLFKWDGTSTDPDDDGTCLQVTVDGELVVVGRWKRQYGGTVRPAMFGVTGDGVTDDSVPFQKMIDAFTNDAFGGGADICVPKGVYRLKDIIVPRGFRIYANQNARDNFVSHCSTVIMPAPGAEFVFRFKADSKNSSVENLYIECDWTNNLQLKAAIRFSGTFNVLRGNNINRCPQAGVISDAGACHISDNNIQGWFGPPPAFTGINDFRGALHIIATGDSYIQNNEIGAALPYFGDVPPSEMLRDPVNRRICAIVSEIYMGNSVVSGNLFENGDRAAVFAGCLYSYFGQNRYELSGGGGLLLRGQMILTKFEGERFADNSLAGDGVYDDIETVVGGVGQVVFDSPIFESLAHPAIPTSTYKVRWNISNFASLAIEIITPQFDPTYFSLGTINNVSPGAFPLRRVKGQYNPENPIYESVTAGFTGADNDTVKNSLTGYVKMSPGTSVANGDRVGVLGFYKSNQTSTAQIGFGNTDNLDFVLTNPGLYVFGNGSGVFAKAGRTGVAVQSNDGANTYFSLLSNPQQTFSANLELDGTTGVLNVGATTAMLFSLVNRGSYTWLNGNGTFANTAGCNLSVICSDGTGANTIGMSSDVNATESFRFSQDNVTGVSTILSTGEIRIGVSDNWIFEVNGYCTIPKVPGEATDFNYTPLVRNTVTGRLEYVSIGKGRLIVEEEIDPALIDNQYMNDNYADVPYGVTVAFINLVDFGQGVAEVYRIGEGPLAFGLWAMNMTANKLA